MDEFRGGEDAGRSDTENQRVPPTHISESAKAAGNNEGCTFHFAGEDISSFRGSLLAARRDRC